MIEFYKWYLPKLKLNKVQKREGDNTRYLSINIITINQPEYLKKCLKTIYNTTPQDFPLSEIRIWENGSSSEIQDLVHEAIDAAGAHPSFEVIFHPHDKNLGFAAAHNIMVNQSHGKYLCMLNDDMEIFEQGWATKMIDQLSSTVIQVGGYNYGVCNRLTSVGHGICAPPHLTEYCDGAFIVMNMEWARALGPWDTDTFKFAYCEDPDLSLRIRSLGYKIKILLIDHIHHRAKTTSKIKGFDLDGIAAINRIRLLNKWNWYISKRDFWVRVAVLRTAAAGDSLMVTSLISKMRELATEIIIDVYTAFPVVFENNLKIDKCYNIKEWPNNNRKYHCVINLNDSYERDTKTLSYRSYYKMANLDHDEIAWPEIYFTKEELGQASNIIEEHKKTYGNGPFAIFHTGKTNWPGRNVDLLKFVGIAKYLQSKGWSIIEVGGQDTEKMDINSTKLQGVTIPVRVSMAVISQANLFIGIDSFPWNVAQTCRVPSVVGFGCIDPKTRILDDKLTIAVQSKDKLCLGCHHEFHGPIHESICPRSTNVPGLSAPCMQDISVEQFTEAIDKIIKENSKMSETAKIREKVSEYIDKDAYGIDIGCGRDKLYESSIGFDRYKTNAVDFIGDAREVPFSDNEFDYVFASHCLEDFIDKESVLKEWCRTIKIGGKMALYLPHKDLYFGCTLDHYELFDSGYIKPILEKFGFTIDLDYLDSSEDRYSFLVIATKNG